MPDGEAAAVAATQGTPATAASLARDLAQLGVRRGGVLLVHCAMSRLGWVCGGAPAMIAALEQAVGPDGTLVMPAFTGHLSEPSRWRAPPVPESWWPRIRAELPAFDPAVTPSRAMGAVAECFRSLPGTRRSTHPQVSFAARGPAAARIVGDHSLDDGFGEASPLARAYELDAQVLLLGVGHERNTSLHLAEDRADWPGKRRREQGAPVLQDGRRAWVTFTETDYDDSDFPAIGAAFSAAGGVVEGPVGSGAGRLMRQRVLVDFGVRWLSAHRGS
jgi:aminoglycoside 3-N-acetyltransferase